MTIKDLKKEFEGQYADIEIYFKQKVHNGGLFHTDNIKLAYENEDYTDDSEVKEWELMNEEEYQDSILANASITADFGEWFDNIEAKILCAILA